VRFEVGRGEDLSAFEDESFDAVCMSSVLHWLADKAKALAEVRRVLRPGGQLGVTTFTRAERRSSLRADLIAAFDAQSGSAGVVVRGWGVLFVATRGPLASVSASIPG
jgi:ubiquinone/menaquinone biosynthesis C-methylase UbiE